MNKEIVIRAMCDQDQALYKEWLYRPHVAKWYHDPESWIKEAEQRNETFCWIHHFIVMCQDKPIGFCQYYACQDSEEAWQGYTALGGTYSIDYFIGETDYLRQGYGKAIIYELMNQISRYPDAKRVVVEPEPENHASCGVLLACGFSFEETTGIYIKTIVKEAASNEGL